MMAEVTSFNHLETFGSQQKNDNTFYCAENNPSAKVSPLCPGTLENHMTFHRTHNKRRGLRFKDRTTFIIITGSSQDGELAGYLWPGTVEARLGKPVLKPRWQKQEDTKPSPCLARKQKDTKRGHNSFDGHKRHEVVSKSFSGSQIWTVHCLHLSIWYFLTFIYN